MVVVGTALSRCITRAADQEPWSLTLGRSFVPQLMCPNSLPAQDEAQAPPRPPSPPSQSEQEPVPGQTTAIVTGVVSIAFGVRCTAPGICSCIC